MSDITPSPHRGRARELAMSRRAVLAWAGAAGLAATLSTRPPAVAAAPLTLVAGGTARAVVVLPPGQLPFLVEPVTIEAESGTVTAPMRIVSDAAAVGGAYVDSPPAGAVGPGTLRLELDLAVTAEYALEGRVWGPTSTSDSFVVTIDDGEPFDWHISAARSAWTWLPVTTGVGASATAVTVALEAGRHIVTIAAREPGARIDQFRLSTPQASTQDAEAVATLVEYVRKSTGVTLPVVGWEQAQTDPTLPDVRIHVGWAGPGSDPGLVARLADLDSDGYEIAPYQNTLTILGPSAWGTRFGVYEFLERQVGVRWLLPGTDGEDVPSRTEVKAPSTVIRDEPSFLSRSLPYLFKTLEPNAEDWTSTDPQVIWATRQRTHSRITRSGNHNLFNIFPTRVYADPAKPDTYRPEIYPVIDGVTVLPTLGKNNGWQPRFDIQATVDIAVDYAITFFDANPDEPLLSLAVNDSRGHSETDLDPTLLNSVGLASASESYYRWVNLVVTTVAERRPDLSTKIFPVLAYDHVIDPPTFDLHPNVVPMITKESHAWSDPDGRPGVTSRFDEWQEHATTLAWYDYSSGARFLAPRLYTHTLRDAYRYAHAHGTRHQHSDMVPNVVGEGPKTWVYAKLLWDIDADVDALTTEWCERAVGRRAAPYLQRYYAIWEEFWNGRAIDTPFWEFSRDRIYFGFILSDYLEAIPANEMARARKMLQLVAAQAETPAQQARAELIRRSFDYYDSGYRSRPRDVTAPRSQQDAQRLVTQVRNDLPVRIAEAARRLVIEAEHEADPVLRHRLNHRSVNHSWTGFSGSEFFHLVDWVTAHEPTSGPVRDLLTGLAGANPTSGLARFARFALLVSDGKARQLAPNGSFEEGDIAAPPWEFRGYIQRAEGIGHDGGAGLRLQRPAGLPQQISEESLILPIDITPGLCAFRFRYRATSTAVDRGQVSVKYHLWTAAGANIWAYQQPMRLLKDTGDAWSWIATCEDIPATASGKAVGQLRLVASVLGFAGEGEVHLDDVQVFSESSVLES